MFNLPTVIIGLIAMMAVIHVIRTFILDDDLDAIVLSNFAFVPGRISYEFDPAAVADQFANFQGPSGQAREVVARFFLGDGRPLWWTFLSYALLHANWAHLGINSLWLAAFGAPVALRLGVLRFLLFLVITAVSGAGAHFLAHRFELLPMVGASAAVSGAMAAAVRFAFQPGAPLDGRSGSSLYRPALSLAEVFLNHRTLTFLLIWFGMNIFFGMLSEPLGISEGPIAWEGHIGGFAAGLLLFPLFDPSQSETDRADVPGENSLAD